uniref:hypothetical protein n=1 Tax=Anaplasma phagocytophilum TaxID=948 RepID=UPI0035713323
MEISAPNIDGKVCKTKSTSSSSSKYATYDVTTAVRSSSTKTSFCGGDAGTTSTDGVNNPEALKEFVEKTLKDGKNWPTSSGVGNKDNDNAKAVAGDLTKLSPEEKTIVAGLLAKTIEGGEVVEIRAVSSTFVSI